MRKIVLSAVVGALVGVVACLAMLLPQSGAIAASISAEAAREAGAISPDELIDTVMVVPLLENDGERYQAYKRLAAENGFAEKILKSENYGSDGLELHKAKEVKADGKEAVVIAVDYTGSCRDYLLFVKENGAWSMDSVTWVNSTEHQYVDIEYTPGLENVWLVYSSSTLGGTGFERQEEVWVDRYGNEALRFASLQAEKHGLRDKRVFASRSTTRQYPTEGSDVYKVFVSFQGSLKESGSVQEKQDWVVYYWDKDSSRFKFDTGNMGGTEPSMTLGVESGTEVAGERFFNYMDTFDAWLGEE
ncbi:MAG: hypothetical protein LBT59_28585 [Clostridiales bacterium]|nr:hypothetical protein [Clostridiales bacterium]